MPRYEWKIKNEWKYGTAYNYRLLTLWRTVEYTPDELHLIRTNPFETTYHGLECIEMCPITSGINAGGIILQERGRYTLSSHPRDAHFREKFHFLAREMDIPQGQQEQHPMEREFANS